LACAGTSAAAQEQTGRQVVATVNGEDMLLDDLERYLASLHQSMNATQRGAFDIDRLMFRAVNDMLLGQEARALGMDEEEPVAGQVERYREKLAVRVLERVEIAEKTVPTDEEVRDFFTDQYREITLRVITAREQASADELLAEIQAGGDMEALALERSKDPYRLRGGLVDSVTKIDLQPEIAELAVGLEPGELGGPVRTDLGWSLIRLEKITDADPDRFPKLERFLKAVVQQRKAKEARKTLAAKLRERYAIRINDEVVVAFRPERLPDGRFAPSIKDPEAVVVRVDGSQVVTAGEYSKALLEAWSNVRNEEVAAEVTPTVLSELIDQKLLVAEAMVRSYAERPEVEREVRARESELLVSRYLEEVVAAGVEVSRDEMEAHFREHQKEYRKPPRIHLGQITVTTMEEAQRIAALLRQGTDLAWLAQQHSIDRFKGAGGDRGWIEPRPGGANAHLLETMVGDVLEPFGTPGNYVVLKVLARDEQGLYSFKEVSGNVRNDVYGDKVRDTIERYMETLRGRSEIDINEELLKSLQITGEDKMQHPHPKPEARRSEIQPTGEACE
jgi:peptidyl-prolyl cis-trans isomerase C